MFFNSMNPEKTQISWVTWALLLVVQSSKSMLCIAFISIHTNTNYRISLWQMNHSLCPAQCLKLLMSISIAKVIALCLADDQRRGDNLVCWRGWRLGRGQGQVMRLTIVEMKVKVPLPLLPLCLVLLRDDDKVLFVLALELQLQLSDSH